MNATTNGASQRIRLERVRLSYFYGFEPYEGTSPDGKPTRTYTTHGIFDTSHPQYAALQQAIRQVAAAAWGDKAAETLKQLAAQDRLCVHKGDVNKPGQDAYAGKLYISCNSKSRPLIVGPNKQPLEARDGIPYSGCLANLVVDIWAQRGKAFGKRINAGFSGVQFVEHGESLAGARVADVEDFPLLGADADDATAPSAAAMDDLLG